MLVIFSEITMIRLRDLAELKIRHFFVQNFNMYTRVLFVLFSFLWSLVSFAQIRETKRLEKLASDLLKIDDYVSACPIVNYLDSIKQGSSHIAYYKGKCMFHTENKASSLPYFLLAKKNGILEKDLLFYIGRGFHFNLLFDSATFYYTSYLKTLDSSQHHHHAYAENTKRIKEVKHLLKNCEDGKRLLNDSLEVNIEHISPLINSPYPDYAPVISVDESILMFTSRRPNSTGGEIADDGKFYEDIYMSVKDSNNRWMAPTQLNDSINSPGHDACIGLSPDGQKLYIYRSSRKKDASGDLYISKFNGKNWNRPSKIKGDINTKNWENSVSLSPNEDLIFFSSDRVGGLGGNDIYVERKGPDGNYGKAENLGPKINTPYDEDSPLIHTDGKTLFYSSKGHSNMGGFDMFSSTYNEKDSTWSDPINLGYPLSTPGDDIYFSYTADGSKGYFSSYRADSYGEKDLYIVHRPEDSPAMLVFKGYIKDHETLKPIASTITLTNLANGKIENVFNSNPHTGKYMVVLAFGKDYNVKIESEGYMYKSEDIHIPEQKANIFQHVKDFFLDLIQKSSSKEFAVNDSTNSDESASNKRLSRRERKKLAQLEEDSEVDDFYSSAHTIGYNKANYNSDGNTKPKKDIDLLNNDTGFVVKRTIKYVHASFEAEKYNVYSMNLSLQRLAPKSKFVLKDIYFDFDKDNLRHASVVELERLFDLMQQNPKMVFEIAGHTDSKGKLDYNFDLSNRRAIVVVNYLIEKGITPNRLRATGYGEIIPAATNATAKGRQINRRTELQVLDTSINYVGHSLRTHFHGKNDYYWSHLPTKVHFEEGEKIRIRATEKQKLEQLTHLMKYNTHCKLAFYVHEQSVDQQTTDQKIELIKHFLTKKGLEEDRIEVAKRSDLPVDETHQRKNSQVEFYILN